MQLTVITRKSALAAILLLVVILVATALRSRLAPFGVELADSEYHERVISLVLAMLLLFGVGIVEGRIFPRSGLNKGYCAMPIAIYGVLSCGIFVAPNLLPVAVVSLCFAVAIYLLLRSLHSAGEKDSVFFASLLLGATTLLYPPAIVLVGVIPLAIFTLALSLRQSMLMVVGYLLPSLAASYALWYGGSPFKQFACNFADALLMEQMGNVAEVPYMAIVMTVSLSLFLLVGLIYTAVRGDKMFLLARVRHSLYLFVGVTFLAMLMFCIPSCDLSALVIIAVPTTIIMGFIFSLLPNNASAIAYWLLLTMTLVHLFVE